MARKTFGDLQEGDVLRGSSGEPVTVTRAYEAHLPEEMFEIELEDGRTIKASGNHLWYIETKLDRELHALRKREARRTLKSVLTPDVEEALKTIALHEEDMDTSLVDVLTLMNRADDHELHKLTARIAESLGHVSENMTAYQDMLTEEVVEDRMLRSYDARLFARQLLALSGRRPYAKQWRVVVGRVVPTSELVYSYGDVDLPTLSPLS